MTHYHTILCIDDDPDDVDMLGDALRSSDPQSVLITAHNGAVGLEQLQALKQASTLPCLIVLDINMPVMDGRQTFMAIRQEKAFDSIPIIVFSTSVSPLDETFFTEKQCAYLTKPLEYTQLLETAHKFLDTCRNR